MITRAVSIAHAAYTGARKTYDELEVPQFVAATVISAFVALFVMLSMNRRRKSRDREVIAHGTRPDGTLTYQAEERLAEGEREWTSKRGRRHVLYAFVFVASTAVVYKAVVVWRRLSISVDTAAVQQQRHQQQSRRFHGADHHTTQKGGGVESRKGSTRKEDDDKESLSSGSVSGDSESGTDRSDSSASSSSLKSGDRTTTRKGVVASPMTTKEDKRAGGGGLYDDVLRYIKGGSPTF